MMKVDLNEMFYVMIQQSEDTQMVRSWVPSRAGVGAVSTLWAVDTTNPIFEIFRKYSEC